MGDLYPCLNQFNYKPHDQVGYEPGMCKKSYNNIFCIQNSGASGCSESLSR